MGGALGEGWGFRPGLRGHGMDEGAVQASVSLPVVWGHQEQQLVPVEWNPGLCSLGKHTHLGTARPPVPQRRLALRRGWVGVRVVSARGRTALYSNSPRAASNCPDFQGRHHFLKVSPGLRGSRRRQP